MKIDVDVLGSPSRTVLMVSVGVKQLELESENRVQLELESENRV